MMKKILASALALSALATPAAAQNVDWSVTVGSDRNSTYYDPWYGNNTYDPYRTINPLFGTRFGAFGNCDRNDTPITINNLRTRAGVLYVTDRTQPFNGYNRLQGARFRPASVLCVDNRDVRNGRVTVVHDVNNNGVLDRRDGVATAYITPQFNWGNRYGAMIPQSITMRYGGFGRY
jgi:hypothetical protein